MLPCKHMRHFPGKVGQHTATKLRRAEAFAEPHSFLSHANVLQHLTISKVVSFFCMIADMTPAKEVVGERFIATVCCSVNRLSLVLEKRPYAAHLKRSARGVAQRKAGLLVDAQACWHVFNMCDLQARDDQLQSSKTQSQCFQRRSQAHPRLPTMVSIECRIKCWISAGC